jgi:hypothetical protein
VSQQFRMIEIDLDLHKLIEADRRSFDEPARAVLRRLLKLDPASKAGPPVAGNDTKSAGRSWSDGGITLPHGTLVRMRYGRDQLYEGQIIDGKWVVGGRSFATPSGAASELAVTKDGAKTRLNGWNYWEVKRVEDGDWVRLQSLRTGKISADDLMAMLNLGNSR